MQSIVVLIAAPGSGAIGEDVATSLHRHGVTALEWLAPGEALQCPVFEKLPHFLAEIDAARLDANIIPAANRRKRLLIADMDSTMIQQECIDELGAAIGLGERISAITTRAMRGELDFEAALRERVGLLKGLAADVIDRIIRERITFMSGGKTLIATMKSNGARTALVSGGFRQFTSQIAASLGFDTNDANDLVIEDNRLAGTVREPILGATAKRDALRRLTQEMGLSVSDAVAVGDGANDLPMLLEAGMGVALHAKPHVQQSARIRINHGDLTALLYLQGYRRSEFVSS